MEASRDIARLIEIMAALRDPHTGCPWDKEQSFASIAPYTIEEAYEVAEAIARGDLHDLRDELGDLLLQVVFHARIAEESGAFAFPDVVKAITAKLIRRHPHVFGDAEARSSGAVRQSWEKIKAEEKRERADRKGGTSDNRKGLLDGVPTGLPALARAVRLQDKASTVGFDWHEPRAVLAKIREEADEIEAELGRAERLGGRLEDEVGDLFFAVANLARHLRIDPEQALMRANGKFGRRFGRIEEALADKGRTPSDATLDEMEALWQDAKAEG